MNYIVSIESQSIPMQEEIAGDDAKLKAALAPFFPGAANSKIMRSEPVDGVITVTVVKQAGTKGSGAGTKGTILTHLVNAPAGENPVVELLRKMEADSESLLKLDPEQLLLHDAEIRKALEAGRMEYDATQRTLDWLTSAPAQPSKLVMAGF